MKIRRKFKGRNKNLKKYLLGSTNPNDPNYDPNSQLGTGVSPVSTQEGKVQGTKPVGAGLPNKYPWDVDMSGGEVIPNTLEPNVPTNFTPPTGNGDLIIHGGELPEFELDANDTIGFDAKAAGVALFGETSTSPSETSVNNALDSIDSVEGKESARQDAKEISDENKRLEPISEDKEDDYFNPYGGVDIPGAAVVLGESIESGNTLGMVGSGLKLAAGLGRNVMGGVGEARRKQFQMEEFRNKKRAAKVENTETYKEGGSLENDLQYFQEGRDLNVEEITGSKRKGDENAPANAELEKGEFFEEPDGTPTEVIGKKHSEGGEKMNLEKDTNVLSDFTKVNKKQAKELADEMGIKFSGKETYANVLSKFNKKIGLTDLIEEEEEVIKEIKTQKDGELENVNEESLNVNLEFLSSKLNDLTKEKEELEALSSGAFSRIFDMQESVKPKEEKEQTEFKIGGKVYGKSEIMDIAKQFNVEEDKALEIITKMEKGGSVPKFNGGGTLTPEEEAALKSDTEFLKGKGILQDLETTKLDRDLYEEHLEFNKKIDDEKYKGVEPGIVHIIKESKRWGYDKELTPENIKENILEFQKFQNKKNPKQVIKTFKEDGTPITADGVDIIKSSNPEYFKELGIDINKKSADFTDEERLTLQNKHIAEENDTDEFWLKQYADGRAEYRAVINKVEPLEARGSVLPIENNLTEPDLSGLYDAPNGVVYSLPEEELKKKVKKDKKDKIPFGGNMLPENLPMMPSGLQMPTKITRRYGRAEPNLITPDAQLTEIDRGVAAATSKLANLPSGQQEAAIVQLQANAQTQKDKVLNQVEQHNNKVKQTTDFFNIRQGDREEEARAVDLRDFEDKAFGAMANTEDDFRRFFNTVQERNVQNFNFVESKNLLNQTSEQFNYGNNGVEFTEGADISKKDIEGKQAYSQALAISTQASIDREAEKEEEEKKKKKNKRGGRIRRKKKY